MINREPITFDDKPVNPYNLTPFGFYDDDQEFQREGPKVASFVARRLGYPVVDVELTHRNIYACFEEAITTYSNQVNQFNAREYMMALQGLSTSLDVTQKNIISTSIPQLVKLSAQYGAEAESGGNVTIKKGYIDVQEYVQSYDLKALWSDVNEDGKAIEIRRIYHQMPPAIARYYDPFATTGLGLTNLMSEFGFDGYSPPVTFVMMPAYEDLLRIQAIEINDMIRKSQYSFKVANNVITFTPMFTPQKIQEFRGKIWFDYVVVDEKMGEGTALQVGSSVDEKYVSDLSNIPYENIQYENINQMSRLWIYRYTLATAKELLGNIRSKYQEIPIPDAQIRLDGEILRREGADEKKALVEELRETLEQTGQQAQMKKQMENAEAMANIFKRIPSPFPIFIG
jgi:hypothetical protein